MAMFSLLIITALAMAFLALGTTEPVIGSNLMRTAQARAMAEAGLERVIWALSNPAATGALAAPPAATAVAASPYNGLTFTQVSAIGGFVVTVTGVSTGEALVNSVGWVPTNASGDPRMKNHRIVTANVVRVSNVAQEAGCALCAVGALTLAGASTIDSQQIDGCEQQDKYGVASTGTVTLSTANCATSVCTHGNQTSSGNNAGGGNDYATVASTLIPSLRASQLSALKALAKAQGTYVAAPSDGSRTVTLSNASDGVIFIDTADGTTPTSTTALTNMPNLTISSGTFSGGTFTGWIIVNGDISFNANFGTVNAMVYAANKFLTPAGTPTGFGTGRINGAATMRNVLGSANPTLTGAKIYFDCAAAKSPSQLPQGWFIGPGTYREPSG